MNIELSILKICVVCGKETQDQWHKPLCGDHRYLLDINIIYHRLEKSWLGRECSSSVQYMYDNCILNLRAHAIDMYGPDPGHVHVVEKYKSSVERYERSVKSVRDLHILCKNIIKCNWCEKYYTKTKLTIVSSGVIIIRLCQECIQCDCGGQFIYDENDCFKCESCEICE